MGQTPVPVKILTQGTLVTLLIGPEQPGVGGQMSLSTDAKFKSAYARLFNPIPPPRCISARAASLIWSIKYPPKILLSTDQSPRS